MKTAIAMPEPESSGRVRYKTGQRVPLTGYYRDQFGLVSWHGKHRTFPPAIGRKGSVAWRRYLGPNG